MDRRRLRPSLSLSSVWRRARKFRRLLSGSSSAQAEDRSGAAKPGAGSRSPTAPLLAAGDAAVNSSGADGAPCSSTGSEAEAAGMDTEMAPSSSWQQPSGSRGSSRGASAGAALALFPTLSGSTTTAGSLASSDASTSRHTACAAQLFADPGGAAGRKAAAAAAAQAAAATARAELACSLAPLVAQRAALAHASMGRLAALTGDVAEAADGRALLELLSVASKAARLSAELRAATLPAAVALLSAAAARINLAVAERLSLEMRVPRTAALMMHSTAERGWLWALRAGDPPHAAALKEEGRQYLRSLWNFYFSDLPGWASPWQVR